MNRRLRNISRLTLALVACFGSSVLLVGEAWAGWSGAARVAGDPGFTAATPPFATVAFDARGAAWVAYRRNTDETGREGLFVARLSHNYHRLSQIHRLRSGDDVDDMTLAVGPSGNGIVAWRYFHSCGDRCEDYGVDAAGWRAGRTADLPVVLAPPGPNVLANAAANSRGMAVVLWSGDVPPLFDSQQIEAARFKGDRLDARTPVAAAHVKPIFDRIKVGVSLRQRNGFRASWLETSSALTGHVTPVAVKSADATDGGVFNAPVTTPWPAVGNGSLMLVSELASNARGDQILVWNQRESSSSSIDLYATSRRAGEPFGTARLIDRAADTDQQRASVAVSPDGRVTILLTRWPGTPATTQGQILALRGRAGQAVGSPQLLAEGSFPWAAPLLVVTRRNRVIAAWTASRPGEKSVVEAATSRDGSRFTRPQAVFKAGCSGPDFLVLDHANGALAGSTCSRRGVAVSEVARYRP